MKMVPSGRMICRPDSKVPRNRKHSNNLPLIRLLIVSVFICMLMPVSLAREPSQKSRSSSSGWSKHKPGYSKHSHYKHRHAVKVWHPAHRLIQWKTIYDGRTFSVVKLPRCNHLETVIAYTRYGETLAHAKSRLNGIAACTGSFHNPRTMAVADFLQKKGSVFHGAKTGRCFVAVHANGKASISRDYQTIKGNPGISAIALGQSLVPLETDGFSTAFMNRTTARMALGMTNNYLFVVRANTDIWKLARFMKNQLHVVRAVNSDGGHVVRGIAPVHVVFRWKQGPPSTVKIAQSPVTSIKVRTPVTREQVPQVVW